MIQFYTYKIPFRTPIRTGGTICDYREGVIIRYSGPDIDIVSEAAPLPGFSTETINDVITSLKDQKPDIQSFLNTISESESLTHFLLQKSFPSSVSFAVSCLALDLISSRNPDFQIVNNSTGPQKRIEVNAVTGIESEGNLMKAIARFHDKGFRTVKIKAGHNPLVVARTIEKSINRYPGLTFRIDANRAWKIDQVHSILENFKELPVQYCEEPCVFDNLNQFIHLKKSSPVPLALDESVRDRRMLKEIINNNACDILILKPTLLGSVLDLIETFSPADTPTIDRVCTTTLETGIGRASVFKLSTVLGSLQLAQGLSTGYLMKKDLTDSYKINNGVINISGHIPWCTDFDMCYSDILIKVDNR